MLKQQPSLVLTSQMSARGGAYCQTLLVLVFNDKLPLQRRCDRIKDKNQYLFKKEACLYIRLPFQTAIISIKVIVIVRHSGYS